MAIFHFDLKPVSRAAGESAIDKWAYITGTRQVDARTGCVYDWSSKAAEILATGKMGPVDWQATERAERRRDAKVARTLIVALPWEVGLRRQVDIFLKLVRWFRDTYGVAVEWAVHEAPGDPRNRHGHLVMTTRLVSDDGVHGKKVRALDVSKTSAHHVMRWRGRWQLLVNGALAAVGSKETVDCRSLPARGITRPARMHMGQTQIAQHRAGYDTAAGKHNAAVDRIEELNAELARASSRLRHYLALRRRERVRRQMRIAQQRRRRRINAPGISPAFFSQHEHPDPAPTVVQPGSTGKRTKTPSRRYHALKLFAKLRALGVHPAA